MMQPAPDDDLHGVVEAVLIASRALVGVAARSLGDTGETITLPQFRALILLSMGNLTAGALAAALKVHPSTSTRLAARLVRKGLISRRPAVASAREVDLALTDEGRAVVREVLDRRRQEIATIVAQIPASKRSELIEVLQLFAEAAGEAPEQAWSLGWGTRTEPSPA
jgi:DNA-binding MarR family transcriptional regulator